MPPASWCIVGRKKASDHSHGPSADHDAFTELNLRDRSSVTRQIQFEHLIQEFPTQKLHRAKVHVCSLRDVFFYFVFIVSNRLCNYVKTGDGVSVFISFRVK